MNARKLLLALILFVSTNVFAQTTGSSTPNDPTTMPEPQMLKMDKDGDGKISRKEADASLQKNWDGIDANHDGMIDAAEYAARGATRNDATKTR